jgi:hypothetical protein
VGLSLACLLVARAVIEAGTLPEVRPQRWKAPGGSFCERETHAPAHERHAPLLYSIAANCVHVNTL